uniref:Uncharacterized protein n=1 Tax=Arundo donax TaxID=35708 RepID=A0A0A8YFQ1_ARUDO
MLSDFIQLTSRTILLLDLLKKCMFLTMQVFLFKSDTCRLDDCLKHKYNRDKQKTYEAIVLP